MYDSELISNKANQIRVESNMEEHIHILLLSLEKWNNVHT